MTTPLHAVTSKSAPSRWAELRNDLRARREGQTARRVLERELATFTTPADVLDLLAAADQHEGAEVEEIRSILAANLSDHHRRRRIAA